MHECMYVCCVYMYTRVLVCVRIYVCSCICTCGYVCMYVCMCVICMLSYIYPNDRMC